MGSEEDSSAWRRNYQRINTVVTLTVGLVAIASLVVSAMAYNLQKRSEAASQRTAAEVVASRVSWFYYQPPGQKQVQLILENRSLSALHGAAFSFMSDEGNYGALIPSMLPACKRLVIPVDTKLSTDLNYLNRETTQRLLFRDNKGYYWHLGNDGVIEHIASSTYAQEVNGYPQEPAGQSAQDLGSCGS
ncbi:hypothetical protein [Kitasatospora cinereorecta]|uniref:Uncharacterized protein n=1 Tax=Kitasatospora cinereorecta TaxID=285560 RepID=A0ABW0VH05_9ACTN